MELYLNLMDILRSFGMKLNVDFQIMIKINKYLTLFHIFSFL